MRRNLRQPCGECPFHRKSMPGWLGPWDALSILQVIGSAALPCHQTIAEREEDDMEMCAGAAIYMNNHLQLCRVAPFSAFQGVLTEVPDAVKETVFSGRAEFWTHHGNGPDPISLLSERESI